MQSIPEAFHWRESSMCVDLNRVIDQQCCHLICRPRHVARALNCVETTIACDRYTWQTLYRLCLERRKTHQRIRQRNRVWNRLKKNIITELTQHLVSRYIDTSNAERWICVGSVFIDGEFPVVNTTREPNWTQCNSMIPSIHRHSWIIIRKY